MPQLFLLAVMDGEFCVHETFEARCSNEELIHILLADYGHISLGRCIKVDVGHFGCKADVMNLLSGKCNGQRNCEYPVISKDLQSLDPCPGMMVFLKVSYVCLKGELLSTCSYD